MKLNNRIQPKEVILEYHVKNLEAGSLPEEEEIVEEAVIPEEVLTLEEEEEEEKEEETINKQSLKRSVDLYSLTLWMTPELNTTPAFNFPQRYLTNLLTHRKQC